MRARMLVGLKFRPQGRDPRVGLDCVGLVLCTFRLASDLVRKNYRICGPNCAEAQKSLSRIFTEIGPDSAVAGDVLLFRLRRERAHLAISCGKSIVHADASLRRIVETPIPLEWPVVAAFRSGIPE